MSPIKEKIIEIIKSLSDDRDENELIEELMTKLMLEKSRDQIEKGQYITHESIKKEMLDG